MPPYFLFRAHALAPYNIPMMASSTLPESNRAVRTPKLPGACTPKIFEMVRCPDIEASCQVQKGAHRCEHVVRRFAGSIRLVLLTSTYYIVTCYIKEDQADLYNKLLMRTKYILPDIAPN